MAVKGDRTPSSLLVFSFAFACALSAGVLAALALVIGSEPNAELSWFLSPSTMAELVFISILVSLPYSAVGAIGGGTLAVVAIRTWTSSSRWVWIRRGCLWGFVLGACSSGAYLAFPGALGAPDLWMFLALLASVGAIAGAPSGALVGAYCHLMKERATRARVSSKDGCVSRDTRAGTF